MPLCLKIQADVETDEVYAQMTLQPLSPVCFLALTGACISFIWFSVYLISIRCVWPYFLSARAKGCLSTTC